MYFHKEIWREHMTIIIVNDHLKVYSHTYSFNSNQLFLYTDILLVESLILVLKMSSLILRSKSSVSSGEKKMNHREYNKIMKMFR